tara:strand:- start:221 stop:472 length:252 start_codon:yes stop_codon:yes gene_type:complete
MEKKNIEKKVIQILNKRKKIKKNTNYKKYYYLDNGHIDSIEIMNFVLELEKVFKIKLNNKDIISREFRSINGLISVIHKKLNK